MFTGIVESVGGVTRVEARGGDCRLRVEAVGFFKTCAPGDSIAVSGVCLTVVQSGDDYFTADLSSETLAGTTAGDWPEGRAVNLERALTLSKPLGGHLVSGHVDGIGQLVARHEDARSWRMDFSAPEGLARYIARKGSICVDGVSLTVNAVSGGRFGVNIVPHTLSTTSLGLLKIGDAVNLEVDLIARYLERLVGER